jgi:hypothetical protein
MHDFKPNLMLTHSKLISKFEKKIFFYFVDIQKKQTHDCVKVYQIKNDEK